MVDETNGSRSRFSRRNLLDSALLISAGSVVAYVLGYALAKGDAYRSGIPSDLLPQPTVQEIMTVGLITLLVSSLFILAPYAACLFARDHWRPAKKVHDTIRNYTGNSRELYILLAALSLFAYAFGFAFYAVPQYRGFTCITTPMDITIARRDMQSAFTGKLPYIGVRDGVIVLRDPTTRGLVLVNKDEVKTLQMTPVKDVQ